MNISLGVAQVFDHLTCLRVGAVGQDFFKFREGLRQKKAIFKYRGVFYIQGYAMCSAIEFFISNHNDLHPGLARELYALRKKTFHERLEWKVECEDNQERDQFDNENTAYLLGMSEGQLFCGARFIDARYPTMTDEIFYQYFNNISLPKDIPCCEITRLFLDKERRDEGNLRSLPASKALFLAMIMYCIKNGYPGMHAVTSRGMYAIFRQANWKVDMLQRGLSEKGEAVYYIFMPANQQVIEDIIKWLREINCIPATITTEQRI